MLLLISLTFVFAVALQSHQDYQWVGGRLCHGCLSSTHLIKVTLSGRGESEAAVAALLAPAAEQLLAQIAAAEFDVRPAPPDPSGADD